MILADIPWLSISTYTLMVIFAVVCLLMCMIIMMQRPKNEGLGAAFGSGTTDQLFGARTTNVLQKSTVWLATMFFLLVLTLSILINRSWKSDSLVKTAPAPVTAPAAGVTPPVTPDGAIPAAPAPANDAAPKPTDKSLEPEIAPPVDPSTMPAPVTPETPPVTPPADTDKKPAEDAPKEEGH